MNRKLRIIMVTLISIFCIYGFSGLMAAHADGQVMLNSGWENSGGTDVTDGGAWQVWGSPIVVSSPVHSGSYACEFTTSANEYSYNKIAPATELTISAFVDFATLPATGSKTTFMWCQDSTTNCEVWVDVINVNGIVYWSFQDNSAYYISSIVATPNTWNYVTLQGVSGNPFSYSIWINGNQIANSQKDGTYSSNLVDYSGVGGWHKSGSVTNYIDDVIITDDPITGPDNAVPEVPFGTILVLASMILGTAVSITVAKRKTKVETFSKFTP